MKYFESGIKLLKLIKRLKRLINKIDKGYYMFRFRFYIIELNPNYKNANEVMGSLFYQIKKAILR